MNLRLLLREPWLYLFGATFLLVLPIRETSALRNAAIIVALAVAYFARHDLRAPPVPLKIPFAIWLGVALISLFTAIAPLQSLQEIRREIGLSIAAFIGFFLLTNSQGAWRIWHYALFASLLILAALKWSDVLSGVWMDQSVFYSDPVIFSTYLLIMTPLILAVMFDTAATRRFKWFACVALVVVLLSGWTTLNRAFFPAFVVIALTFAALYGFRRATPRRIRLWLGGLAILVAIMGAYQFVEIANRRIEMQGDGRGEISDALANDPRLPIWQFGLDRVAQHPFAGVGFGKYTSREIFVERFQDRLISHGHNIFLNYALQMGIQGIAALLILLAALLWHFWRLYRSGSDVASLAGIAGLCLLVGFMAKNITDDLFFRQNALLFWSITGMLLGHGMRAARDVAPLQGCA